MHVLRFGCMAGSLLLVCSSLGAQISGSVPAAAATPKQQSPQSAGLETPWDARRIVAAVEQTDEQLRPLLAKMNPQRWYDEKGAPSTYIVQWQTAQQQLNDVATTTRLLEQKIDSLSAALDVYFRMEALDVSARSLNEGAQRYADRSTADELSRLIAQNFTSRERFRDYIKDLASSTEQNFKIADEEAQRCRGMISQQPLPKQTRKK
ncbi:MAG TPA: hypothetical protein VFA65_18100 [Bryobacteraceae bacterium]|nr:hypothetical protein [Bryobacteraceae bacterium]